MLVAEPRIPFVGPDVVRYREHHPNGNSEKRESTNAWRPASLLLIHNWKCSLSRSISTNLIILGTVD